MDLRSSPDLGLKLSGNYTRVAPATPPPNTTRAMRRSRAEDDSEDDEENDLALLVCTIG